MAFDPWLTLKLDLLPSIAQEVEQIQVSYNHLSEEVRKGNKQAYQDLILLQAKIRGRMDEFDRFYDRHYADYRIGYFENLKLRLRKLISPHIDVNRLILEETQNYNQLQKVSPQKIQKDPVIVKEPVKEQPPIPPPRPEVAKIKQQSPKAKIIQKKPVDPPQKAPKQPKTSELVFNIKMSKEEYLQYIQAKNKK